MLSPEFRNPDTPEAGLIPANRNNRNNAPKATAQRAFDLVFKFFLLLFIGLGGDAVWCGGRIATVQSGEGGEEPATKRKRAAGGAKKGKIKADDMPRAPPGVNYNQEVCDMLLKIARYEQNSGNIWKARAYNKAAGVLSRYGERVTDGKHAQRLEGIGKGVADKIDEFFEKGTIDKLEEANEDPTLQAREDLERIHGVGPKASEALLARGVRSVAQLRQRVADGDSCDLKAESLRFLPFVDEFEVKIPPEEARRIADIVQREAAKAVEDATVTLVGAFRRHEGKRPVKGLKALVWTPEFTVHVRLKTNNERKDPDEARKMMNRKDAPTYLKEITDHLLEVGVIDEVITVGMQQRLVAVRPVGEIGKKEKDQGGQAKADDDEDAGEEEEKAASAGAGGEGKSVKVEAGRKQAAPAPAEPRAAAAASGFAIPSLEEVEEEAEAAGSRAHVWEQGGLERARAAGKTESRAPEQRGPEIVRATEEEQAAAARVAREAAERVAKAGAGAAKKGPPHRKMELILVPYNFRVAATMLYTCDETFRLQLRQKAAKKGLQIGNYAIRRVIPEGEAKDEDEEEEEVIEVDEEEEGESKKGKAQKKKKTNSNLGDPIPINEEREIFRLLDMHELPVYEWGGED